MKKHTVYTICLAFLAAGMASCAKTTKGKVTNEWKVTAYENTQLGTSQSGDLSRTVMNMTETTFMRELTHTDNNGTVVYYSSANGSVNAHELTIKKDGTWTWVQDITYIFNSNSSNRILTEESGTWSFVGKTKGDDFKKNERVLFNVLNRKESATPTNGNTVGPEDIRNTTFLTGEYMQIYTIKESKKTELQLELESNIVSESGSGGVNKDENLLKITLKEK